MYILLTIHVNGEPSQCAVSEHISFSVDIFVAYHASFQIQIKVAFAYGKTGVQLFTWRSDADMYVAP